MHFSYQENLQHYFRVGILRSRCSRFLLKSICQLIQIILTMSAVCMDYLQNSSFPGALELIRKKDVRTYLEGVYNTILIKDIQSVVEFIFDNIGNMCSSTKIANAMTSSGRKVSVPTVESYLSALADSFIIYKVGRYDIKGKQYLATGSKYYVADIGLRYFLLGTRHTDMRPSLKISFI